MKVTVYTKPDCQQCVATKRWLWSRAIAFEVEDLTDPGNLEAVKALGHASAPVVVVGEESWSGFRPDKLEELAEQWKEAA